MGIPPTTVGHAVDTVFAGAAYQRSAHMSMLEILAVWINALYRRVVDALAHTPGAPQVIRLTLYAFVALIVIVIGYRLFGHYRETRGAIPLRFGAEQVANLWAAAERAAQQGEYTTAAHVLYAALLQALVLRGVLRFHSSKTTGDYVRELRRSHGGSHGYPYGHPHERPRGAQDGLTEQGPVDRPMEAAFIEFVRAYELVIYRDGHCDETRYVALRSLAAPVVGPRRAAA